MGCEPWENELLKDGGERCFTQTDQRGCGHCSGSPAIGLGIVKICESCGAETSKDVGVIRLPSSIIPFADNRVGYRIEKPRSLAAGSLVEITRILFQNRRQDRTAEKRGSENIAVGRAVALCIPLHALPIGTPAIGGLVDPS